MRASYKTKDSSVTIKLTFAETTQFLSQQAAVEAVRTAVQQAVGLALQPQLTWKERT